MTDDTPTERFDVNEPDTTAVLPTAGGTPPVVPDPEKKSRTLLWVLIGIGGALLIALIILLIMLFNRGGEPTPLPTETTSSTPSPTPTESESPTPSPTPTETEAPPVVVGPTFDSFDAQPSAGCAADDESRPLTFSWSSSNAARAYIGVDTLNAKNEPYASDLPVVYTYSDLSYQCSEDSQIYTVTLEDSAGLLAHQTVTISK